MGHFPISWLTRLQQKLRAKKRRSHARAPGRLVLESLEAKTLLSGLNISPTEMVSEHSNLPGNGSSDSPRISADGRFVVFSSEASDLVPGDNNDATDIFVRDLQSGSITRVSVSSSGIEGDNFSYHPSISGDGRFIAFESNATNLVPNDTNRTTDIFVHDMQTGATTRASVNTNEEQGISISWNPAISANGRYVAFESPAYNWLDTDTGWTEIWVRDLQAGTTSLVSMSTTGGFSTGGGNFSPSISDDGRLIAFQSDANNLVAGDSNNASDIFVRDIQAGTTIRASVTNNGNQANGGSGGASISGDGSMVVFVSAATKLVSNDTNGVQDLFVRNLVNNTTQRITVNSGGVEANGGSFEPSVSRDGHFIVFRSFATNLDPGVIDSNGLSDVFVYDRNTKRTNLISLNSNGVQANGASSLPVIDAIGHQVAYLSSATNLDLGLVDGAGFVDVFTVTLPNQPPVISGFDAAVTYVENALPLRLDTDATVTDSDSPNFGGGKLTVSITANKQSTDVLSLRTSSSLTITNGNEIRLNGLLLGTFTGGTQNVGLTISLNANATPGRTQNVLRNIAFSNSSENPSTLPRTVQIKLTDGNGGTSSAVTKTVNVTATNDAPVISGFDGSVDYSGPSSVILDANATVTDADSTDFSSGQLTVSLTANAQGTDLLWIRNQGTGAGKIGASGSDVTYGGIVIGTFTGGANNVALTITFNANATSTAVQALLRNIQFKSTISNPSTLPRTVQVSVTDGDGGTSLMVTKTISIV